MSVSPKVGQVWEGSGGRRLVMHVQRDIVTGRAWDVRWARPDAEMPEVDKLPRCLGETWRRWAKTARLVDEVTL